MNTPLEQHPITKAHQEWLTPHKASEPQEQYGYADHVLECA